MGKVVKLKVVPKRKYPDVVACLRSVMDEAKAGDVSSVAVAVVRPNGFINAMFSESDNAPGMMGAVSLLQHRLIRQAEDEND